jgi:hypothetical protein
MIPRDGQLPGSETPLLLVICDSFMYRMVNLRSTDKMRIRYPILACLGLLAAAQANAAGFFENMAIRGGLGVGYLNLNGNGFDGHAAGWNLFTGFEFNRYLAVEAGYLNGGTPNQDINGINDEIKNYSWHGSVIGSYPVRDEVSFYARGGLLNWHATERFRSGSTVTNTFSDSGTDPMVGLGIAINVDGGLLRLEYDRSKIDEVTTTYISISGVWRFRL